ncbi:DNA/RNA helicase domain-containing protein [Corynebacterium diphtheriae]|nr:DNA/RNA helicase domain-containing protein [Corynebacterium diphtheriae]
MWIATPRGSKNKELSWAEKPHTINEVGSIFTIQGFDLNYAGVIIGPISPVPCWRNRLRT